MPDFGKDMRIDPMRLDQEWLEQPELLYSYMEYEAVCKHKFQEALDNKKTVASTLKRKGAMGGEPLMGVKPTGENVENWAKMQKPYEEADAKVRDAQLEVDKAIAATLAVRCRRDALENLVKLVHIQYFAPPHEANDLSGYVSGLRRDRSILLLRKAMNDKERQQEEERAMRLAKETEESFTPSADGDTFLSEAMFGDSKAVYYPGKKGRGRPPKAKKEQEAPVPEEGWVGPDFDMPDPRKVKEDILPHDEADKLRGSSEEMPSLAGRLRLGSSPRQ